ncbi:retrovirus-related pol polyprotein from transposon TNT 1-94 [Tanacetum coccineum]
MKVKESLNVTFDETPPPPKTSPLEDDDLVEEQAIEVSKIKPLGNDLEDKSLENNKIINIKESKSHPVENVTEPKNINEALKDESWVIAMQKELNQLISNDVWELVPNPKDMTIIGTKWVFRNKLDENGVVSRNKARLVAQDIVNIIATSCAVSKSVDMSDCLPAKCCLELETEPFKQNDIIEKGVYDKLLKDFSSLEKHCISVELSQQLTQVQAKNTIISKLKEQIHSLKGTKNRKEVKKDIYEIETQNIEMENRVACLIKENEHLKQTYKNLFDSIKKKRNELRKLRGKDVIKNDASIPKAISIAPGMYKLDLEPLAPRLLKYKDAPIDYIKYTQTQAGILRGLVEQAKVLRPLDNSLDYALIGSTYDSGSKPTGNTKKSRISQPSSSKPKNKVKDQSRKFESNANKQNRVSKTICNATVKQSSSNANSESLCPTCNECVFSANHDMCVLDYVHNVYVRAKSKSKRNKKRKVWKPTSKVFTDIGYRWKPTKRTFTIDGNRVSTAKLRVSTAKLTVSTVRRKYYYCWFKITAVGEKVNAVESLLVVSTEVNVD